MDGSPKEFTLATVNGTSEPQDGREVSLLVRGLHLHEEIMLNRVWAIDYLSLPRGGTPAEEESVK